MKTWKDTGWWQAEAHVSHYQLLSKLGDHVFPSWDRVYAAFELTPFDRVRVVILGQDPYINQGQANGLAFSVADDCKFPPSLQNIFQELKADTGIVAKSGDLTPWAKQGVLLLNTCLTVKPGEAGSHTKVGWQKLTQAALRMVIKYRQRVVFVLWGSHARETFTDAVSDVTKEDIYGPVTGRIVRVGKVETMRPDKPSTWLRNEHKKIVSSHPSPRSAYGGFFGSKPFSRVNALIDGPKIDWRL